MTGLIFGVLFILGIFVTGLAMFGYLALIFNIAIQLTLGHVNTVFLLGISCFLLAFGIMFSICGIYDMPKRKKHG